jgi:hypothetical protein
VSEINNKDILWISQGGKGMRTERERGSKGRVCVEYHSTSLINLERSLSSVPQTHVLYVVWRLISHYEAQQMGSNEEEELNRKHSVTVDESFLHITFSLEPAIPENSNLFPHKVKHKKG